MRPFSNSAPVVAGIYTRMSLAIMGDTTKVEDQARISLELCAGRDWRVAQGVGYPDPNGIYCDNNRSAWQLNRKRPGWDQMLADVEAGKINAIVVYHGDRLIRQPRDLEDLIDLARARGTRLASPTGERDLGNPDDQYILRIEAAGQCRSSDDTSRRKKRQYARWRSEGRVRAGGRGGRAFGYRTDNLTSVPEELEAVREMARRVLAGQTAGAVARGMSAEGWRTPAGKEFSHTTVRKMLARPRYAGLMPDGESAAAWEAALDRQTWEQVCVALDARSGLNPAPTNARRWLLSGIAECGACGGTVQIGQSGPTTARGALPSYCCAHKGCGKVRRNAVHLDRYVAARVVALLNDPRQPEGQPPVLPDSAPEWAALASERAQAEAKAKDYRTSPGRLDILMARLDSIDARMAELRERETAGARSRLLGRYRGITREAFDALPLEVRRALVAASYRVTVLPASGRGPGFRTEDVRLEPAGS